MAEPGKGTMKGPQSRDGLLGCSQRCCPAGSEEQEVTETPPLPCAGCGSKTSPIPPREGVPPGTKHSNIALASSSQLGSKLRQSEPREPSLYLREGVRLNRLRLAQTPVPLQSPGHELGCKAKGERGPGQQSQDEPRGQAASQRHCLPCRGEPSWLHLRERELSARSRGKLAASSQEQAAHPHQGNSPLCVWVPGRATAQRNTQRSVTIAYLLHVPL